ncbi:MAG TPA: hypothetical protein VK958_03460 [Methylophilus sp.]|uniref:hypothetical protein n=1 Tax=Methylophilus sp. TaxID=29541 RepID=UPI002CBB76F1|nr:hypothetical protein [Methylophilus sp.]HSH86288.1 hypothetical protein [Methylophilus sp.]
MKRVIQMLGLAAMLMMAAKASIAEEIVNARYETTQCATPCMEASAKRLQWWLMREDDQVEIRHLTHNGEPAHNSSLWMKKPAGQFNYSYLMHEDGRAIDYSDVDLKLLAIKTDAQIWQVKSQLIADEELARLKKVPADQPQKYGYTLEKYVGELGNGVHTEVLWMPALKLPYTVQYHYPEHTVTIQMQVLQTGAVAATDVAAPPKATLTTLTNYQHVDYADLGDMEHNPSEMQWLARAHGAPGLQAHTH